MDLHQLMEKCKSSGKLLRQFANLPLGIAVVTEMLHVVSVNSKINFCKK